MGLQPLETAHVSIRRNYWNDHWKSSKTSVT